MLLKSTLLGVSNGQFDHSRSCAARDAVPLSLETVNTRMLETSLLNFRQAIEAYKQHLTMRQKYPFKTRLQVQGEQMLAKIVSIEKAIHQGFDKYFLEEWLYPGCVWDAACACPNLSTETAANYRTFSIFSVMVHQMFPYYCLYESLATALNVYTLASDSSCIDDQSIKQILTSFEIQTIEKLIMVIPGVYRDVLSLSLEFLPEVEQTLKKKKESMSADTLSCPFLNQGGQSNVHASYCGQGVKHSRPDLLSERRITNEPVQTESLSQMPVESELRLSFFAKLGFRRKNQLQKQNHHLNSTQELTCPHVADRERTGHAHPDPNPAKNHESHQNISTQRSPVCPDSSHMPCISMLNFVQSCINSHYLSPENRGHAPPISKDFQSLASPNQTKSCRNQFDASPLALTEIITTEDSSKQFLAQIPEILDEEQNQQRRQQLLELCREVQSVAFMASNLYQLISEQAEPLDQLEERVETVKEKILQGEATLHETMALTHRLRHKKLALFFMVMGAGAGCLISGPLGLAYGSKVGISLATTGGACLGLLSTKIIPPSSHKKYDNHSLKPTTDCCNNKDKSN